MANYMVEPTLTKTELNKLSKKIITNVLKDEHIFVVKEDNNIIGFTKISPITGSKSSKALWINYVLCDNHIAQEKLLKETLKYSWELGYDAIFADSKVSFFSKAGFCKIDSATLNFKANDTSVWAMDLSWEGISKFQIIN